MTIIVHCGGGGRVGGRGGDRTAGGGRAGGRRGDRPAGGDRLAATVPVVVVAIGLLAATVPVVVGVLLLAATVPIIVMVLLLAAAAVPVVVVAMELLAAAVPAVVGVTSGVTPTVAVGRSLDVRLPAESLNRHSAWGATRLLRAVAAAARRSPTSEPVLPYQAVGGGESQFLPRLSGA